MRQIVLDTETTGLQVSDGHRIIEIGCIELINRKFTGNKFHYYLNPNREIDAGAYSVHGISNQFLEDKPTFTDIVEQFIEFITGAELVIHNAPFDLGFINYELTLANKKYTSLLKNYRVIDTLVVARQLHVGQRNSLDALCKRYSIDNSERDLHGALLDAHLLAHVYLSMTGGQGSLFEDAPITDKVFNEATNVSIINEQRKLRIIKASSEELALHESQLKNIDKKAKCLWLIDFNLCD